MRDKVQKASRRAEGRKVEMTVCHGFHLVYRGLHTCVAYYVTYDGLVEYLEGVEGVSKSTSCTEVEAEGSALGHSSFTVRLLRLWREPYSCT